MIQILAYYEWSAPPIRSGAEPAKPPASRVCAIQTAPIF